MNLSTCTRKIEEWYVKNEIYSWIKSSTVIIAIINSGCEQKFPLPSTNKTKSVEF